MCAPTKVASSTNSGRLALASGTGLHAPNRTLGLCGQAALYVPAVWRIVDGFCALTGFRLQNASNERCRNAQGTANSHRGEACFERCQNEIHLALRDLSRLLGRAVCSIGLFVLRRRARRAISAVTASRNLCNSTRSSSAPLPISECGILQMKDTIEVENL